MNNHPVFRVNQTGYAVGMPVYIAFLGEGAVRLTDGSGRLLRELHQMPSPIDQSSGDPVSVLDLGILPEGCYTLENNGFVNTIMLTILATLAVGIIVGIIYMLYQFGIK